MNRRSVLAVVLAPALLFGVAVPAMAAPSASRAATHVGAHLVAVDHPSAASGGSGGSGGSGESGGGASGASGGSGGSGSGPGWATYQGKRIDLANGWGTAHACWVDAQGSTACYSSASAMAASTGLAVPAPAASPSGASGPTTSAPATTAASGSSAASSGSSSAGGSASAASVHAQGRLVPQTSCSNGGALYLYQNVNYGGNVLGISQANTWIDLANYGFADQMSSWINVSSCGAWGEHTLGGSSLYMPAETYNPWVGNTWNDQVVWVDLQT